MDNKLPSADQLLNIIPCGVVSFETSGQILYCNQKFQDFTGYTASEIIGQKIEKFLTLPGKVFFQTHFLPLLRLQNAVSEVYLNFNTKSGQSLPLLLNGQIIVENEQAIIHCTCFPLNHRSKYEEQLLQDKRDAEFLADAYNEDIKQQLDQEKEGSERHLRELKDLYKELLQFQKIISHDMSEQMRKIYLFTDRLIKNADKLDKQKEYGIVIGESVFRARYLLDRLSQFIALTEKDEKLQSLDMNKTIHQAFRKTSLNYSGADGILETDQSISFKGLPLQIETLFLQLMDNSFKYRRKDTAPHIKISTLILPYNSLEGIPGEYRYHNYLQILYTDNSQGFQKQYSDEAFILMNRITDQSKGGFGLPFCKKIVNNHHGFITINPAFNNGVQVKIYLRV